MNDINPDILVGVHFRLREFACPCNRPTCQRYPAITPEFSEFVKALDSLRDTIGEPIIITSGYRCPEHNAEVGGAPESRHLVGDAVDIRTTPSTYHDLLLSAEGSEFINHGIGTYNDRQHLHLDWGPERSWNS